MAFKREDAFAVIGFGVEGGAEFEVGRGVFEDVGGLCEPLCKVGEVKELARERADGTGFALLEGLFEEAQYFREIVFVVEGEGLGRDDSAGWRWRDLVIF